MARRDTVEEESACTIRTRFYDPDDVNVTPQSAQYRLWDVTNCRQVVGWTPIAVGPYVDIDITAQNNRIHCNANRTEERVLTVQANYGEGNQFVKEYRYVIENLRGFES